MESIMLETTLLRDISLTYGEDIVKPERIAGTKLENIINIIKNDDNIKRIVFQLRSTEDKKEKEQLKKTLPYFIGGIFNGIRNKNSFQSTDILIFDLDHVTEYDIEEKRKALQSLSYALVVFLSPSGYGLKLIVKLSRQITSIDEYYSVYNRMLFYFKKELNLDFDPATKDPARACFLSHDENIYVNEFADAFDIDSLSKTISNQMSPISKRSEVLNAFCGVDEGQRHNNMLKMIGLYIDKGFDHDFAKMAVSGINQLNHPPMNEKEFNYEFEKAWECLNNKSETVNTDKFWSYKSDHSRISIDVYLLQEFLTKNGFYKYKISQSEYCYLRIVNHKIFITTVAEIKEFVKNFVEQSGDSQYAIIIDCMIKRSKNFFSEDALQFLKTFDPIIKRGTKSKAFLFFRNVFVEISSSGFECKDYHSLDNEFIWKENIIEHDLIIESESLENNISDYDVLIRKICRDEEEWYNALTSAIGYLLHDYKDRANARAIIFCDEELPLSDDANGGTGKSLVACALKYLRKGKVIDGKNFKSDSAFNLQKVDIGDEIVIFDDVRKDFEFECLLSMITSDLTIEKKHRDPQTISFEQSPKFIITTNYTINGIGNSFDRRKHEIEFSNYFNKSNSPDKEFGHRLFDDWNYEEWNRFYLTVIMYIRHYLKNGLVAYTLKNLPARKVINSSSVEFLDFVQDNIQIGKEYKKSELLETFKNDHIDYAKLRSNTFTRWLKNYAESYNLKMDERKSNKDRYFTFYSSEIKQEQLNSDNFVNCVINEEEFEF